MRTFCHTVATQLVSDSANNHVHTYIYALGLSTLPRKYDLSGTTIGFQSSRTPYGQSAHAQHMRIKGELALSVLSLRLSKWCPLQTPPTRLQAMPSELTSECKLSIILLVESPICHTSLGMKLFAQHIPSKANLLDFLSRTHSVICH